MNFIYIHTKPDTTHINIHPFRSKLIIILIDRGRIRENGQKCDEESGSDGNGILDCHVIEIS